MNKTMEVIAEWVTLVAHSFTAILGAVAIWGLLFHRKKITAFAQLLAYSALNERTRRIKAILGRLESLNYDDKSDRKEIVAMLAQLAGMVRLIAERHEGFRQFYAELRQTSEKPEALSEGAKRRLSEELHALLDEQGVSAGLEAKLFTDLWLLMRDKYVNIDDVFRKVLKQPSQAS
jgi:hypothetical protein